MKNCIIARHFVRRLIPGSFGLEIRRLDPALCVRTTSDSRVASEWVDREKFDGIVLDLLMPKLDGFDLTAAVRRSTWNLMTPVIIVSGHEDRSAMQRAFAAGASFFLPKPVDREKLTRLYKVIAGTLTKEQRRFRRIPFTTEVTCEIGMRKLFGRSIDISEGGILFQGDNPPAQGQAVRISPTATPQARGRGRHGRPG